ncbi:hypothetical protein QPL79_04985 [Ignisphaera sp. 4213-co]|uniref:Uncharacterized protein n=1 Tax=Ignisphaera cupida TaxID=3050454 RepID=A0ABD4Z760_9CREN|nr:hypothetical protein [Ignisphaera sp. 4213-co]MDK6028710.1 hypothetical protein [Ignisphaera sp. 4213-co]
MFVNKRTMVDEGVHDTSMTSRFNIYSEDRASILLPMVQFKLSNGSVLVVHKRNPFEFDIDANLSTSMVIPQYLRVFRVRLYNSSQDVFNLALKLGINTVKLYYNERTKQYIFHNATHVFEYSVENGFLRFKLRETPSSDVSSFPSDDILIKKAIDFLKERGLLYFSEYEVRVGSYLVANRTILVKAVVINAKLDDITVDNLGLVVLMNSKGDIIGVEGTILAGVYTVGEYRVKPVNELMMELKRKIARGEPMTNWYISWLAFTKLRITDLTLRYYMTYDGYLVPVYIMKGYYELDYDTIRDSGEIRGLMVAIKG